MVTITKIPGLGDYGVFVDGADLENISIEEWKEVYGKLHLETLVTIFRGTNVDPFKFYTLVNSLGPSNNLSPFAFFKKHNQRLDPSLPNHEAWNKLWKQFLNREIDISDEDYQFITDSENTRASIPNTKVQRVTGMRNEKGERIGIFAEGELLWHCNESGHLAFTPGVGLLTVQCVEGSSTGFNISAPWYERQTEAFRSELDELVCLHHYVPGKMTPGLNEEQNFAFKFNFCPEDNYIPLVIKSPAGIRGLHYSFSTVDGFKDMSKVESDKLLAKLNTELLADSNVYDHLYKDDRQDMLLFDNSITQHRRLGDVSNRLLYRCTSSYSSMLPYQYQPYFQTEYKNKLRNQLNEVHDILNVNFKPFEEDVQKV
jgi:hypothetical protein